MGRIPKTGQMARPTVGTIYLQDGYRGQLHVSIMGAGRTLCGIRTDLVPAPVTVHDRITCASCANITMLIRDGYVDLVQPRSS
jgi:hypothetical protein